MNELAPQDMPEHSRQRTGNATPGRITFDLQEFKMPRTDLERYADTIPSMGGTELGSFLRQIVRDAPEHTNIVEVGTWLGAGTAQLALGVLDRGSQHPLPIHCYDRWRASAPEVKKANCYGLELAEGMDTLPVVKRLLAPFGVPIRYHKTRLKYARWSGGPISVYVDDASKDADTFSYVLYTFGPSWVPNETIVVLMDFHFWRSTGNDRHKAQHNFMQEYADYFEKIDRSVLKDEVWDAFLYKKRIDFSRFRPPDLLHRRARMVLGALGYRFS